MAKFCNKCGKELVDGKCPNCTKEEKEIEEVKIEAKEEIKEETKQEESKPKEVKEENNSTEEVSEIGKKVAEYLKMFFNTAKGMLKDPEKVLSENKTNNWIMPIIVIVINSLIFGFAINYMLNEILPESVFSMLSTAINSVAGLFGKTITSIEEISQAAGLGFAVNSALIVIIVWVMHEIIFRKKLNILAVVSMLGKCQSLFTIELIITIIVSLFSVNLALILLPAFVISCLVNIHYGIIGISKVNENQIIYIVTLGNLLPIISIIAISFMMIILQIATTTIRSGF